MPRLPSPALRMLAAATAALSLPACGGSSYERWAAIGWQSPFSQWASCIEEHSSRWWHQDVYEGATPEDLANPRLAQARAFAAILTRCESHSRTPAWEALSPDRRRRMVRDAEARFYSIGAAIQDDMFRSII